MDWVLTDLYFVLAFFGLTNVYELIRKSVHLLLLLAEGIVKLGLLWLRLLWLGVFLFFGWRWFISSYYQDRLDLWSENRIESRLWRESNRITAKEKEILCINMIAYSTNTYLLSFLPEENTTCSLSACFLTVVIIIFCFLFLFLLVLLFVFLICFFGFCEKRKFNNSIHSNIGGLCWLIDRLIEWMNELMNERHWILTQFRRGLESYFDFWIFIPLKGCMIFG